MCGGGNNVKCKLSNIMSRPERHPLYNVGNKKPTEGFKNYKKREIPINK
jgi:hypothetical protein